MENAMRAISLCAPALFTLATLAATVLPGCHARAAAPAPADIAWLNRVTWGATESALAKLQSMGPERWLDGQLHPTEDDRLPAAAQAEIDALAISQQPMTALVVELETRNKAANQIADMAEKQKAQQAYQQAISALARQGATRQILRDLYSPAQLREQMTWFWFNHFNVFQSKAELRAMVADYEEQAIRPHVLGRFRDLLEATLHHPAMLRYLDNAANAAGHTNENYAREIMELHTMGVSSGYTQQDVEELARCLTGVGVDTRPENSQLKPELQAQLVRDGLFEFNPARHDYGDKVFLGRTIKGQGLAEVAEVLDILARQPATARHIARQLAVFFVADPPPPALVQRMAQTFQQSDGDIAKVLLAMFHAPEFAAAAEGKFKDPIHYVLSAVRLAYGDRIILNTAPVQGWLNRMGEGIYNHETPDGYSLSPSAWDGPGQLAVRFEIARQIGSGSAGMFKPDGPGAVDQPAFPQLQNALYFADLRHTLSAPTRTALEQAISPQDWNFFFLSSPEFMY
jgi:uncharacterized protein (DUF1800 family)